MLVRDGRGGGQAGDLGRDRRGRVPGLLLPALHAVRRAVRDEEVRGGLDVVLPQRVVAAEPGQVGHQDRVGGLVQLVAAGVRRGLAVEQRVARYLAGRQLLVVEQELDLGAGRGQVAVGQEAGERLVGVAGEYLAVGAVVDRLAVDVVARVDRLAPGGRERGDHRARERLVLAGLQHVRVEVVGLADRLPRLPGDRARRPVQGPVVGVPGVRVRLRDEREGRAQRGGGGAHGLLLRTAEPEGEGELAAGSPLRGDVLGGHDVPVGGRGGRRQRVGVIELGQPVARGALVADGGFALGGGGHRHVGRHRVRAVGRLGGGVGAVDDRDAGARVDDAGVAAGVLRPAASVAVHVRVEPRVDLQLADVGAAALGRLDPGVHQHRVALRIGDVGGDKLEAVLGVGRGDRALHAGRVGLHGVGHVAGLEVGEG